MKNTRIRLLAVLLSAILLIAALPVASFAADIVDSGVCGADGDNITWTLDSDGVLTLNGIGATGQYSTTENNFSPFERNTNITSIIINDGITEIGASLFANATNATSVSLAQSVNTIGAYAFYNCFNLISIAIPDGVEKIDIGTFIACSSLEEVVLPDTIESIGYRAFHDCRALKTINIPDSVKYIGEEAFYYCSSMKSLVLPEGIETVDYTAFRYCKGLESVTIPKSIPEIRTGVFAGCTGLKYVFYAGTAEEWQELPIGDGNSMLTTPGKVIMHYGMTDHTPVETARLNVDPATCINEGSYDAVLVCAQDGCDVTFPNEHRIIPINENNHVNTVEIPESDSTETEHGYTAGVYCNDCGLFISGHVEKPLLVPDEPITEPEEPTTEPEEPTTEEPISEPEPTAPVTEPVTDPTTEPSTEPTTVPTTTPAAPTGAIHGARCFCYNYTGSGLMVNIVRLFCAVYNFFWNLREAVAV